MASQWEQIKWIPGTRFMVDGFRYQTPACKTYFLTHFHSDHTTGLARSFTAGMVFCTPITARLLRKDMRLPTERICELPLDKPVVIEGTEVTPICANHCPGACMFLFKVTSRDGRAPQTILHTGDMRWSDEMAEHPALKGQTIDILFMDTTYAKPNHTHPPQDQCIAQMAEVMQKEVEMNSKTVFMCGSYHIGKERAYLGAAKLLGWKVWCEPQKSRVLRMLDLPSDLMACLATKPTEAKIHVEFLGGMQPERLRKKLETGSWTHAVGFRPTGWTFRRSGKLDKREEGNVKIYGIPYSEHSSWTELRSCVALLRPRRLVPTVNASNANLARAIVNRFADLMDLSEDRSRLDFFLRKRNQLAALLPGNEVSEPCTLPETVTQPSSKAEAKPGTSQSAFGQQPDFIAESDDDDSCSFEQPLRGLGDLQSAEPSGNLRLPGIEASASIKSEAWSGSELLRSAPSSMSDMAACKAELQSAEPGRAQVNNAAQEPSASGFIDSSAPTLQQLIAVKEEFLGRGESEAQKHFKGHAEPIFEAADPGSWAHPCWGAPYGDSNKSMLVKVEQDVFPDIEAHQICKGSAELNFRDSRADGGCEELLGKTPCADSSKSKTEPLSLNLSEIDVSEQVKILQSIGEDRKRMQQDIAQSLLRKKQATLSAFFGRPSIA